MNIYQVSFLGTPAFNAMIPEYVVINQSYADLTIVIYLLNSNIPTYKVILTNQSGSPVSYYFLTVQYNLNSLQTIKLNVPPTEDPNTFLTYFALPVVCCGQPIVVTVCAVE